MLHKNHFLRAAFTMVLAATFSAHAARNDFDKDGRSDMAVYDPVAGRWYFLLRNGTGVTTTDFGYDGTLPVTGDFDGDGFTDIGTFSPSQAAWYFLKSTDGFAQTQFGLTGSLPVTGDFDGDGRDDFGCYLDDSGNWLFMLSTAGFVQNSFGFNGTLPVTGDFDGDSLTDYGCYYPPSGDWYFMTSTAGFFTSQFGFDGTLPFVGDFDDDGIDDYGCAHHGTSDFPQSSNWFVRLSTDGFQEFQLAQTSIHTFPVTGDYDGDGVDDYGVFNPSDGSWNLRQSTAGDAKYLLGHNGTFPIGTSPTASATVNVPDPRLFGPYWYGQFLEGLVQVTFLYDSVARFVFVLRNSNLYTVMGTYEVTGDSVYARAGATPESGSDVILKGTIKPSNEGYLVIRGRMYFKGRWHFAYLIPD